MKISKNRPFLIQNGLLWADSAPSFESEIRMGTSEGVWGSICDFSYFGLHSAPQKGPRMQTSVYPIRPYLVLQEKRVSGLSGPFVGRFGPYVRVIARMGTSEGVWEVNLPFHVFPGPE